MRADQEFLSIGHADLIENARHVMSERTITHRQLVGNISVSKVPVDAEEKRFAGSLSLIPHNNTTLLVGADHVSFPHFTIPRAGVDQDPMNR